MVLKHFCHQGITELANKYRKRVIIIIIVIVYVQKKRNTKSRGLLMGGCFVNKIKYNKSTVPVLHKNKMEFKKLNLFHLGT